MSSIIVVCLEGSLFKANYSLFSGSKVGNSVIVCSVLDKAEEGLAYVPTNLLPETEFIIVCWQLALQTEFMFCFSVGLNDSFLAPISVNMFSLSDWSRSRMNPWWLTTPR